MIKWDFRELDKLIAETSLADQFTVTHARRVVREASFAVEERVKRDMPVDTGRARASWGHGPEGIWASEDGGLSITQGSNVPYIVFLNAGHSRQAPAGFIDNAAMVGQFELERELGLIDPLEKPGAQLGFGF